eukprot:3881675-Rhodomonas_salina.1
MEGRNKELYAEYCMGRAQKCGADNGSDAGESGAALAGSRETHDEAGARVSAVDGKCGAVLARMRFSRLRMGTRAS